MLPSCRPLLNIGRARVSQAASGCRKSARARRGTHDGFVEETMTFGRGALLWLLGIPLPVIIILALFTR